MIAGFVPHDVRITLTDVSLCLLSSLMEYNTASFSKKMHLCQSFWPHNDRMEL